MRTTVLLLGFWLLYPIPTVQAQERTFVPTSSSAEPASPLPGALAVPVKALDRFTPLQEAGVERDRGRGALYGAAVGALVGGVGFAGISYVGTKSTPRDAGVRIMFVLGAVAGSATGALVGALIGAPERDGSRAQQVRLHVTPGRSGGGTVAVSLSPRSQR